MCLVFGRHGAVHTMHDKMGRSPVGPGVWVSMLPQSPTHPPSLKTWRQAKQTTSDQTRQQWRMA